jgi:hypothetical protein
MFVVYMFGQFGFEFEFECDCDCDGVVDEPDEPDEDDDFPLAAFAIAAPPTAIAATTTTAASVFCIRVINQSPPSRSPVSFESTAARCENAVNHRKTS